MNQEQVFLADIVAHPEDSTSRLVYADWLEERGDHQRAAFWRSEQGAAVAHLPKAAAAIGAAFAQAARAVASVFSAFAAMLPMMPEGEE
jgi:uncharacterized protein (TIGR02996 family)